MHKQKFIIIFFTFIVTIIVPDSCRVSSYPDNAGQSLSNKTEFTKAPSSLLLPQLSNPEKMVNLADYQGQMVLVHFFASWCPHCRSEHPLIVESGKIPGLKIVGVGVRDNPPKLKKWLGEEGNPYAEVGLDNTIAAARQWNVTATPASFLIDGKGNVIFRKSGPLTADIILNQIKPLVVMRAQ